MCSGGFPSFFQEPMVSIRAKMGICNFFVSPSQGVQVADC